MRRRKEVITVGDKVIIDKKYFLEKMWNVKKKGNHIKVNRVGEVIEITKREPEETIFTVVMDFGKKFAFSDRSLFRLYEPVVKKSKGKEKPSKSSKQLVENIVVDGGFKEVEEDKEKIFKQWDERYTEEDIDRVLNMDSYQDTISNVAIAVQENRDGSLLISAGDKNKSQENIREWVTMLYKPKFSDAVREEVKRNISENRQIIKVTDPHEPNGIDKISYNTEEYDVEVHLIRKTDRPTEDFPIENNNAILEVRPFRLLDYTADFNPTNPENVKMWGGLSSGTNLESVTGWGNPMLIWEQNQFRKLNPEDITALFNKPLSHSVSIPEPVEMKAYTRKDLMEHRIESDTMRGEINKPEIGIVPEYINREKVAELKSKTMEQVSLGLDIEAAENRIDEINKAIERRTNQEQDITALIPTEWIEERNRHIEFVRKTKLLIKI